MTGKADSLAPDDAVWKRIIGVLREAAEGNKDYDYLIVQLGALLLFQSIVSGQVNDLTGI